MMTFTKTEVNGPEAVLNALRRPSAGVMAKAAEATAAYWDETYLGGHFEESATAKYHYQPRSGEGEPQYIRKQIGTGDKFRMVRNRKYYWRKKRQKRHVRPLVWSGRSERAATTAVKLTSKKMGERVQGIATYPMLPKYFYAYRKDQNQPDKANEMTRVIPAEISQLEKVFEKEVQDRIHTLPPTFTSKRVA